MKILHLAAKDLSQILRDRKSLLFLLAMPIAFTLFMGFAYGTGAAPKDSRLALGLLDLDGGPVAARLIADLGGSGALSLKPIAPGEGREAAAQKVSSGELSGLLVIPSGWSSALLAGARDFGDPQAPRRPESQLELVADSSSPAGQTLFQVLRASTARRMSSAMAAILGGEADRQAAFEAAEALWEGQGASGAAVREESVVGARASGGSSPYNQSSPGMLVMFAVFGLVTTAGILVQERKTGTLQRLRATSMAPQAILGGHLLAMFAVVLAQTAILVAFGQLALGVDYGRVPLGILLVSVALSLCMACAGLLIGVLAKGQEQVTLFGLVAMFLFSALGGAWFPLEGAGAAFSAIGRLTPSAWAMTGFQNILVRGQGFESTLLPAAALLLFSALFFTFGAALFRKELRA
jgi:ABC-2 type transport system permease protein